MYHSHGFKLRELRVGLVVLKGEQETVVEERVYTWLAHRWDHWQVRPSRGVVQLHWLPRGEGEDRRYELSFGAGDDGSEMNWTYAHKPKEFTIERLPYQFHFNPGMKSAGEQHVVRLDLLTGTVDEDGTYRTGGESFTALQDPDSRRMDALRRLTKRNLAETYMVTTLRWAGWE
jgi:hypothetical protein